MAEIYRVKNVEEALELANKFKASGKYDLFRGQSQNWDVIPLVARLEEDDYKEGLEKIKRLYDYFHTSKNLLKYKSNVDWFFAVAQHYGLPTSYIDFTTSCEVATFFATNSESNKIGIDSVIICLNEADFNDFITVTKVLYEKDKVVEPYIAKIDVDNLWRLQSQKGLFLFTPYTNIERFYNFDRIIFPFEKPYTEIEKDIIYPTNKSELEIYLDYYFNKEERIFGQKRFAKFAEDLKIPTATIPEMDVSKFLRKSQHHKSWSSTEFSNWKHSLIEGWDSLESEKIISLKYPNENISHEKFIEETIFELEKVFINENIKRNHQLKFSFSLDISNNVEERTIKKIQNSCSRIWHGTRNLPFTNHEIHKIISNSIFLEFYENKFDEIYSISGEKLLVLEMTNQYDSITRFYASKSKVREAFRDDIEEILTPEFNGKIGTKLLLNVNKPQIVFDFNKLLGLFKEEIIAYQVVYNSEKNNPVIFYSPTEISILGYT